MNDVTGNGGRHGRFDDGDHGLHEERHPGADAYTEDAYTNDTYAHDTYTQDGYDDPGYDDRDFDGAHAAAPAERTATGVKAGSGLPLRGLAMVLIAVAILLGLWGIYALTSGGGDDSDKPEGTDDTAASSAPATPGTTERTPGADESAKAQRDAEAQRRDAEKRDADNREGERPGASAAAPAGDDAARGAAGAGAGAGAAAAPQRVNVLNNSTVPDLAAQVSDTFRGEGTAVGEVGNLPGDVMTVAENTVFFHSGDAAVEQRARELADRVGGVAREYDPALPDNTAGASDLTLVLANPVQL